MILYQEANIDAKNNFGNTALLLAASRNFKDIARLLVDAGADVNIRGERDFDATSLALNNWHLAMAQIIMSSKKLCLKRYGILKTILLHTLKQND